MYRLLEHARKETWSDGLRYIALVAILRKMGLKTVGEGAR
jgi:hypothetical protein